MQSKIPLLNYAPDADPTTPGVITACANLVPSLKGYKGAPAPATGTLSTALAANCQGAATVRKLDNTSRTFAATGTAIYEAAATSWTDRTRASGGAYAAGSDLRWSFAQYGDVSLATVKSDTLQASTTGAMANVTGAPKASIVETAENFVFLFDTNEATYGDSPNRWWCCARGDYTDWTPAISTQSATGLLSSIPGKITAAKRFGNGIVVYKQKGMYVGTYVGAPVIWDFQEIPGSTGAQSQESVVDVGTSEDPKHIFMGFEDFYVFAGSRPIPIGENMVKEAVFNELNKQYAHMCRAVHDRINSRVYFYYPSSGQITPDKCVVYNYKTGKWGRDDRSVQACWEYLTPGVTYDDLGTLYSTYDDFPNVSYDSSFWTNGFPTPAIINTSKVLQTLNGNSTSSSLTSGDIGDDSKFSLLSRVKPRFITAPTSASMANYYRNNLGDSLTTDATTSMSNSRFDVIREARWHRFREDFTGPVEITGNVIDMENGGDE